MINAQSTPQQIETREQVSKNPYPQKKSLQKTDTDRPSNRLR